MPTQKRVPPIAQGWNQILAGAPSDEERKNAESWRSIFYGGANWLWVQYCKVDGKAELEEFIDALETELDVYREETKQRYYNNKRRRSK